MKRKVVVTGMGVLSSVGKTLDEDKEAIFSGKNGIGPVTRFDPPEGLSAKIAGEIKGFDPSAYLEAKEARRLDPVLQYAIAASVDAFKDAGLSDGGFDPERAGVVVGSGIGGISTFQKNLEMFIKRGPRRISPFFIPMILSDMPAGMIAIRLNCKGPNYATVSACATGSHSIADGLRIIRQGEADIMVCGGTEAGVTDLAMSGFAVMGALSTRNDEPEKASRPFDKERDGFVMGEGAGILVLEDYEHAKKRGARIYAEVAGAGATGDAHHMTAPDESGDGAARAMRLSMADAELSPSDIGYINAHGTSTPLNDKGETKAIKSAMGNYASKVKISSTKSMTGHLLGAAGGIEAIASVLALREGIIPPTINYEVPDPECDLDYTPNKAFEMPELKAALSNNLGFGGHNVTVA
ncbi:MAG: beta-ketoacyl-ACP synthase II, partial [Fibrobacterota bacterium]